MRDFDAGIGITHPEFAWRLTLPPTSIETLNPITKQPIVITRNGERCDGATLIELLAAFLDDPASPKISALLMGAGQERYGRDSTELVEALAAASGRLPALRALFLGEIVYEELEIAVIRHGDVSELLRAFPDLERFHIRGNSALEFSPAKHARLKHLVVEGGGLQVNVLEEICELELPELEHLELWLGSEFLYRSTTMDDLETLLSGRLFPKLKHLGLRNCEGADELAATVAKSKLLGRLKTLDMSLGDLGDEGVRALLLSPSVANLEEIDIHHHYVSKEIIDELTTLGPKVNANDKRKDEYWGDGELFRSVFISK